MKRPVESTPEVRPLEAHEFEEIRKLARQTFGLELKAGKEELVSARLRRLVQGGSFQSFREYCAHVREDRTGAALAAMIDALATNHTSFLREPDHFRFLQERVLPALGPRPEVRIWSAACSSGEEVWTLACVLNDSVAGSRVRICASDVSGKALRTASAGTYLAERCRDLPAAWKSRYFVPDGQPPKTYTVHSDLRRQVAFQRLNLVGRFTWPGEFAAIFCRNVMIYFDRETQQQVVRRLSDFLEPGGYLFVGHAESLSRVAHSLEYVQPAIYRKPGKRSR